jgi:electron transfer flavoprotein alpha subunit
MKALVFVDGYDGVLDQDALGVLSKIAALDAEVAALVCGHGVAALATEAARHGAKRVLVADHPALIDPLAAPRADVVVEVLTRYGYDTLWCATTVVTTDMAATIAARLEAGLVWGLSDIDVSGKRPVGRRLAQGDTVLAEVAWTTAVMIGLFRPHACEPVAADPAPDATIEPVEVTANSSNPRPRFVARVPFDAGDGPPLAAAEVVVSGGRGIETPENLSLIRELAAALGGVAGVSLPLVEMGWAPRSMQVGQTGTVVRPRLYVACGISGQIQHRVGMENSGTIVAINKSADAPIMSFCDLAVVADIQSVVPRLIELLHRRRDSASKGTSA